MQHAGAANYPKPAPEGHEGEIEVRQLFELDDFEPSPSIERFKELQPPSQK